MAIQDLTLSTPTHLEEVMTRSFRAPRDLVFEAHTSCEHLRRWWGPRRYEVAECAVDLRVGGAWRIVHHGPEGEEHVFSGEFREIDPPERFVWTFAWGGAPDTVGIEEYVFTEVDPITTITATGRFGSKQERDALLADGGMEAGARETYERLEEYLAVLRART